MPIDVGIGERRDDRRVREAVQLTFAQSTWFLSFTPDYRQVSSDERMETVNGFERIADQNSILLKPGGNETGSRRVVVIYHPTLCRRGLRFKNHYRFFQGAGYDT